MELQYHNEQNKVFLFKCYCYDTIDRGIKVDPHHGLVKISLKVDSAMSTMSLFLPSNVSKFITHTIFSLERIVQELIGYS
jgi:hypothetical protein